MNPTFHQIKQMINLFYNLDSPIVETKYQWENDNLLIFVKTKDRKSHQLTISYETFALFPRKYQTRMPPVNRKLREEESEERTSQMKELEFFFEILKKYSNLIDLNALVNSTAHNRLVIGKTQSSKSSLFWCLVWIQSKIIKVQPIVVCFNSKESRHAMIHKEMKDFNRLLTSHGVAPLKVVSNFDQMDDYSVPILLGNTRQLKKLKSYISQHPEKNFIVNVDEADLIFQDIDWQSSSKKLQRDIKSIMDMNVALWLITATPFAIWFSKLMDNVQTFILKPKESYRSLQNGKIKVALVDKTVNLKDTKVLLDFYHQKVIPHVESLGENSLNYYAILYDSFHTKKSMLSFAQFVSKETQKNAYVVNRMSNKVCVQQVSNGILTSLKFSSIEDLFNHLERENSKDFQHLIAGEFASRANTWRPSRNVGSGGLIAHVNYSPTGSHMERNVQKQRQTGEYDDSFPTQLQIMQEKDYYDLIRELENIESLSKELEEPCHPREKIDGKRINHVGPHSRPSSDDSKYSASRKEESLEFENHADFENFTKNKGVHNFHSFMNEVVDVIPFAPSRPYTNQEIKKQLLSKHPNIDYLHIATTKERFDTLNNIYQRHFKKNYANGRYTVGSIDNRENLYLIQWKENFTNNHFETSEKEEYNNIFKHHIYFPYYATNGKIRVYKNDGRKTAEIHFSK